MTVPFVDLHKQYISIKSEIDHAIARVINDTAFIRGPYVKQFKEEFAADYGVKNCIPVANGTDAIYIALKMLGIGPGDEVITTAHSWISTSETIIQTGAIPVFVDVDEFYTIDSSQIKAKITDATRAIIPVHLYGHPADMDAIMRIAEQHQLYVIEDCAQAHYATINGQRVGTFGDVGTFSFYPGKNLGAYGDAGAILTNSDELAEMLEMYANHGALIKHRHKIDGINSRMDGLQAAILSVKLKYIHQWTRLRQEVAKAYDERLSAYSAIQTPTVRSGCSHVFHLYVIQIDSRDEIRKSLTERGIQTAIQYPQPLPLLAPYTHLKYTEMDIPRSANNSRRILSLPLYPEMTSNQITYVTNTLKNVIG